jgi:hypothetical protein
MAQAACIPGAITREPAKAVIIRSRHGPHSGELEVERVGLAVGAAERRHVQPNSKAAASPSRKQIEPPRIGGKSKIV